MIRYEIIFGNLGLEIYQLTQYGTAMALSKENYAFVELVFVANLQKRYAFCHLHSYTESSVSYSLFGSLILSVLFIDDRLIR